MTANPKITSTRAPTITVPTTPSPVNQTQIGQFPKLTNAPAPLSEMLISDTMAQDERALRTTVLAEPLMKQYGIYYLMDATKRVIYVGKSADTKGGMGERLKRHLLYSKTDSEGQNRICVEEIAYVGVIPLPDASPKFLSDMEKYFINKFSAEGHPLMQTPHRNFSYNVPIEPSSHVFEVLPKRVLEERLVATNYIEMQTKMLSRALMQYRIQASDTIITSLKNRTNLFVEAMSRLTD